MGAMCRMIQPERIKLDAAAENKEDCLRQLVAALELSGTVTDSEVLFSDVIAREKLSSTALGSGCAVPHAHSDGVKETIISAGRFSGGLDFAAEDGSEVTLVFLMVGPKQNTGLHLKVLSKLARLLHDGNTRAALLEAGSPEDFYSALCGGDE